MKVLKQIEHIQRNCAVFTTAINKLIPVTGDNQVIKQIEKSVQFKIKILDQVSVQFGNDGNAWPDLTVKVKDTRQRSDRG